MVIFFWISPSILAQAISLKRHVAHARCRRGLVLLLIDHWFACVRHGPVVTAFFAHFPSGQVMSQPRRSARLAARFARASPPSQPPQPMAIDLTDTEPISDGLSDDPVLSEVDVFPAPSCFVCDGHFASSGPLLLLSLCLAMLPSFHSLAVCHRSGASAFSICRLPRLQFSVPFFLGLPPLPALVLCPSSGGSCRRVHGLFISSDLRFFLLSSLLPSTHSLRMFGSVSPHFH